MKKSLLKKAWDGLLYGVGRDVLAIAVAGSMMLAESPVGYARYAYAEEGEGSAVEQVETTPAPEPEPEVETQQPEQQTVTVEPTEESKPAEQSQPAEPAQPTTTDETIEGGVVIRSVKLFGEFKFFSVYVVDKDGNVADRATAMPDEGLTITDEYGWSFRLKADDNYEIESVGYRQGTGDEVKLTAKDEVYTIAPEVITKAAEEGESLTLVVKTKATAATIAVDLSSYSIYAVDSNGTPLASPMAVAPTRSFAYPLDKDFDFQLVPVEGIDITEVSIQVGGETSTLEADDNGTYTITQGVMAAAAEAGNEIQLVVSTSASTEELTSSNLPIPITMNMTMAAPQASFDATLEAEDSLPADARNFSHNLEDYLDKYYDTSAFGTSGITINDVDIDKVDHVSYGDTIKMKLAWGFPNTMAVKAGDEFTFQLPDTIAWAFDSGAAQGSVTDATGAQVGTFVIDSTGKATITYSTDLGSNVVGSFTATGVITRIAENGDDTIISFSLAGKNWNVRYTSGESKVEISKSGGGYVEGSDDLTLRQFTIEVLSLGENENVVVTDTPNTVTINKVTSAALEYVEGSLRAYSDAECIQEIDQSRVSVGTPNDDGSFEITIASMSDFERIYLRYESRITLEGYNAALGRSWNYGVGEVMSGYDSISTTISNTASISTEETSTVDVPSFMPSYIRQKTGKYNADASTITWTVTAYTGDTPLTLQEYLNDANGDNHYNQLLGIQNIHLYESTDGGSTYQEVALSVARNLTAEGLLDGTATLPGSTKGGVRRYFRVVFDTPVDPYPYGQTYYENWIAGNGRVFSSGRGVYAGVTVGSGASVSIEKTSTPSSSYINYDTEGNIIGTPDKIHWVSHVSVPVRDAESDPYTDFVITDTEQNWQNQRLVEGSVHVYSDATQQTEITSQFTLEYIHQTWNKEDFIQGFTLKSDNFRGGELYITVDATIVKVTSSANFTNKIAVNATEFSGKTAQSTHYVNAHRLSKRWEPDLASSEGWRGSGWSHTNSETGRVTWSVVVAGLGNGELDHNPTLTVKDSAPDRLVVDPNSFRYVIGAVDGWHTVVNQGGYVNDIEATIEGGTITFDIKPSGDAYEALKAGRSIVLVYDTTYNPDYSTDGFSTHDDKVTNTVGLSLDGQSVDTVSSSFTFKHQEILTKEAEYNESTAPNAIFTIEVNYWSGDLDPNSDSLTLIDEAGSALSINTNSITVTTYDIAGKVVDDHVALANMADKGFSYTRNTKTGAVTFTVPDGLHFSLSYESLVELAPGTTIEDESASNSVTLSGYTTPSTARIGSKVHTSRATTTSLGYGVMIEKVDADYTSLHVANATYVVERVDVTKANGVWQETGSEVIGELTTGESGFSQALTGLAADQIYRLRETDSPEGYELSSDVFYLVFQGAQGEETVDYSTVTLKDKGGTTVEYDVYSSDTATKRILMSDHQTPGSLTIYKTSENTDTPGTATFTVTGGPRDFSQTISYSDFKDGKYTVTGLVPGEYTVTENVDSAEKPSYSLQVYVGPNKTIGNSQSGLKVEAGVEGSKPAEVYFTNEYTRYETEVPVSKTWVGETPENAAVTVHLLADGARLNPDVSVVLSAENSWHHTFTGLPIYTDAGDEITYTVVEDPITGYETTYSGNAREGITVTNTFNPRLLPMDYRIVVQKVDSDSPDTPVSGAVYTVERVDVTAEGNAWTVTGAEAVGELTTVDGYSAALEGLAADTVYRVSETTAPEGYDVSDDVFYFAFQGDGSDLSGVTLSDANGTLTLNVYNDIDYTSRVRNVTRVATMSDQQTRGSLTITKTTEGEAATPASTRFTVTGPDFSRTFTYGDFTDGSYVIEGLVPGTYTVEELDATAAVGAYDLTVRAGETAGTSQTVDIAPGAEVEVGFTNEYERITTSVSVEKRWVEPDDARVETPESVTVHLLRDGELLDPDVTIELTAAGDWKGIFADLPVYDADSPDHAYAYSVQEDHIEPYDEVYSGNMAEGYVITNTYDETTLNNHGIRVEKVDTDFPEVHVGGATYVVERVDVTTAGTALAATGSVASVGTIVTDENDYSEAVDGLEVNTIYRLREDKAPEGYELSEDVFYFVFQGTRGEVIDYANATFTDADGNEQELTVYNNDDAIRTVQRTDHKIPGTLTITKDSKGAMTPAGTVFTVTGPKDYGETFTYADFTNGTLVLRDLVPGEYTVAEESDTAYVGAYTLTVAVDDKAGTSTDVTVEPDDDAEVTFTNTYERIVTSVPVAKVWEGPTPDGAKVTVHLLRDGAPLEEDVTLELTAANGWKGTFADLPVYDENNPEHAYIYSVLEDDVANYLSAYEGNAADGYTITNTFDTTGRITATKHAFGVQGEYGFTLVGADADGNVRSSAGTGTFVGSEGTVDFGQALELHATTGGYNGTEALVVFPDINYREPGDYYYLMSEDAVEGQPYDDVVYLVHVTVGADASIAIDYTPQTDGGAGATSDTAEFYNNGGLMLFGMSAAFAIETGSQEEASYAPVAHKELDGRALAEDEFSFLLIDAEGTTVGQATNDAEGVVAFDVINYTEAGTYSYTIVEENTNNAGIDYDATVHTLEVTVTADADGVLSVESAVYDGDETVEFPTFYNSVEVVTVGIQKVSREGDGVGDPLVDSVYGLWMVTPEGNDIYLGNDASDEKGYIYIENVPVNLEATYYFKEEAAPEGHLVDPYKIAFFRIVQDADGIYSLEMLD